MDWQGQKLSEQLMQWTIVASAFVAFFAGYLLQSYRTMMLLFLGGSVLTMVVALPDWSYFNQHPLSWQPARPPQAPAPAAAAASASAPSRGARKEKGAGRKRS